MRKRGMNGPGLCVFCKREEESNSHILLSCPVVVQVWTKISIFLSFTHIAHVSIEASLIWWSRRVKYKMAIPFVIFWKIWKARNYNIFGDKTLNVDHIIYNILTWLRPLLLSNFVPHLVSHRKNGPDISFLTGFFDSVE